MNRLLSPLLFVCLFSNLSYSQCNTPKTKMLIIGDSWAFFSWTNNSYNENMDNYGLSDIAAYSTSSLSVNGAEAGNFFTDPVRVQELEDYITSNPDLEFVHMSLGGNDVLGDWNVDFTAAQTDSILDQVFNDIKAGIDTIHAINPDLKILMAGYDYPNFDETVGILNPTLQPFHPFFNLWDSMGQPTAEELNGVLELATQRFADSMWVWPNVFFVNNLGLMQNYYGQTTALQTPPYGTYQPGDAPVPGGFIDYPSPLDALNFGGQDAFHLNDEAYEIFVGRHFEEFYWWELRAPHQTVISTDSINNGWVNDTTAQSDWIKLGNDTTVTSEGILHFDTSVLDDTAALQGVRIYIQRDSLSGTNLSGEDLTLTVKSGHFGANPAVETDDYADAGDLSAIACTYGSVSADGNWMSIDVPPSLLPYVDTGGTTQFKLSYAVSDSNRLLLFGNEAGQIFMDVYYSDNPFAGNEDLVKDDFTLYPNPVEDMLFYKSPVQYQQAQIFNMNGQLVQQSTITSQQIDVSQLENGIYLLQLMSDTEQKTVRFVKK